MAERSRDMQSLLNMMGGILSSLRDVQRAIDAVDRNLYDLNSSVSTIVLKRNGHNGYRAFRLQAHRDDPMVKV